jgi:hypothetical protein
MREDRHVRWTGLILTLALTLAGLAGAAARAAAETVPGSMSLTEMVASRSFPVVTPRDPTHTFGTASEAVHVISQTEFEAGFFSDSWGILGTPPPFGGLLRFSTGTVNFAAGVRLPAGAVITRVELDGLDDDSGKDIGAFLLSATSPAGSTVPKFLATMSTGVAATPGAGLFPLVFAGGVTPADLTIDNTGHYYVVGVILSGGPSIAFSNVRVFYRLQVSPAPGAATFGDVPTSHPFFQYIQALVASGITAGCGSGNYCPDAALTRGQMAVFLSKALGLHFAP